MPTESILVGLHISNWEMTERLELHNLHTDHVIIQSEHKYLIGAKVLILKFCVFGSKTDLIAMVRGFVW
jgi:hypothetical protein